MLKAIDVNNYLLLIGRKSARQHLSDVVKEFGSFVFTMSGDVKDIRQDVREILGLKKARVPPTPRSTASRKVGSGGPAKSK